MTGLGYAVELYFDPEAVPAAVEVCRTGQAFGEARLLSAGIVRFRPVEALALFPLGER